MIIKFYGDLSQYPEIELFVDNLKQLLSGLKLHYGQELADKLLNEKYFYILADSKNPDHMEAIHPDLATMLFDSYDTLMIVPEIEGGAPAFAAALAAVASAVSVSTLVEVLISVAVSIALNMLSNLLSPTLEFDKDPAAAQKLDSALFNGAPNIREQGSSVPLVYGLNVHCGGVLISSGLSTEEKTF
ncbi:MAG: hypothetical protein PHY16_16535 [Methylobacter sp.]|nr:hypothetical protein [Methylobacter sp.]